MALLLGKLHNLFHSASTRTIVGALICSLINIIGALRCADMTGEGFDLDA